MRTSRPESDHEQSRTQDTKSCWSPVPLDPTPPCRRRRVESAAVFGLPFALVLVGLLAASCGSRGPLDDTPLGDASVADAPVEPPVADATPEASSASPGNALSDAGGILGCGLCLFNTCGSDLQACFEDEGCRGIFQCVLTECAGGDGGGGGLTSACAVRCAGSDPLAAIQLFGLFQCVTGECGSKCESGLGGLGALLGGGGRRDGG